ncbi:MAG: Tad domain-containing protein [Tepidisphaeraceae bacterium]
MALVYGTILLTAVAGFAMLAVDVGLYQLARSEAQTASDAIARYAATGFASGGATQARTNATAAAADVRVAGQSISFNASNDVQFGVWDASNETFTTVPAGQEASATAIRVSVRMTRARSKSVPTYMARAFGITDLEMTRQTTVTSGKTVAPVVSGKSCPWMAGLTSSAVVPATDDNPQSITGASYLPTQVNLSSFSSGSPLRFRQSTGTTGYAGATGITMDGDTSWIVHQDACNGINGTSAPIGCLVGIFLDNRSPTSYGMSAEGNFSTSTSRNQTTISPALKQVFFIGDGLTDSGVLQNFVPPAGATRLYLGIMDEKGWWWDNTGQVTTQLLDTKITLVQ